MTKKEKKTLKEKKISELKQIFKNIPKNKESLVQGLIEQAVFMCIQLNDLSDIIEKNGVVEKFEQGKQKFNREQPAVKTYNAMIKNYNVTIKQLLELIPPGEKNTLFDDDFDKFKQRRNI